MSRPGRDQTFQECKTCQSNFHPANYSGSQGESQKIHQSPQLRLFSYKDYQANTREETNANFRHFATPRERYWVGRVRSLWPHGLNSECPGKPAAAWVKRVWCTPQQDRLEIYEDEVIETSHQVSAWLHRQRNEGGNALNELKNWDKAKLRETLDWVQKNVPPRGRRAKLVAVKTAMVEDFATFSVVFGEWTATLSKIMQARTKICKIAAKLHQNCAKTSPFSPIKHLF